MDVANYNPSLMIVHARGASSGVGVPAINSNNHPFTNSNKSIGLVHNGRIEESEYQALKQKYKVSSDCDSEILLRIFEAAERYPNEEIKEYLEHENPHRLAGCRDIFSLINRGHMAVATGERGDQGERMLWLFRNEHRPLWIMDMRESLGQVFFVSEPSIWDDSVYNDDELRKAFKCQNFVELPPEEIWFFKLPESNSSLKFQRFKVKKTTSKDWEFNEVLTPILKECYFDVVTGLDENDDIISFDEFESEDFEEYRLKYLINKCNDLSDLIVDLKLYAEQLATERSISRNDFEDLISIIEKNIDNLENWSSSK
jgi:hypothetical protein